MASTPISGPSTPELTITSPVVLQELRKIFSKLTTTDTLAASAFQTFLTSTQHDHTTNSTPLSFTSFISYLARNTAPAPPGPSKDWSRPLNEYFVSSSHNTYLIGHQLYGNSTTAGYKSVLQHGCRCIEIDVWDGNDGEPEVFHGYTLTKEISFRKVCRAVAKYGFSAESDAGEGPIIISLECHAGAAQQDKIVVIMKEEWGDMLVRGIEPEDVMELPSPLALKRKILIKADIPFISSKTETKYHPSSRPAIPQSLPRATTLDLSSSSDTELSELSKKAHKPKPKRAKITRSLASLGIYCSAYHLPSVPSPFNHPTSHIPNHIYSFSEKAFSALQQQHSTAIFTHNQNHLMRVYPNGTRFTSSNGDPTPFWRHGAQLVALNWQKVDKGNMLNHALFAAEQGYVLKPSGFRPADPPLRHHNLDLRIDVIAAAGIPLPAESDQAAGFRPYVKCQLHVDGVSPKARTKARKGIECVWGEKLEFKRIAGVTDGLAFVRFKIQDEEFGRDDLAAWSCIRLDRLQQGYRFVKLFDNHGQPSKGYLFIKVSKRLY